MKKNSQVSITDEGLLYCFALSGQRHRAANNDPVYAKTDLVGVNNDKVAQIMQEKLHSLLKCHSRQ